VSDTQARLDVESREFLEAWLVGADFPMAATVKLLLGAHDARVAELERVTAALRDLREAAGDYHQGCECGGSGVITACSGRDTEGCCGACERTACEVCPDLLVALYQADAALAGAARAAQDDYENRKHEDRL
jgi:hypothetical protein